MQIFKLKRGQFEHGISPISREFFGEELGEIVTRSETQGHDVIVQIAGKITNDPARIDGLLKRWADYYQENRNRYGFTEHILYPKGTELVEYLGPHDDKRYGKAEDVKIPLNIETKLDTVLDEYEKAVADKGAE